MSGGQSVQVVHFSSAFYNSACKHPFEENVKADFYEYDVSELTSDFVASLFNGGHTRVLAGCAPWQPFSTYTRGSSGRMLAHVVRQARRIRLWVRSIRKNREPAHGYSPYAT